MEEDDLLDEDFDGELDEDLVELLGDDIRWPRAGEFNVIADCDDYSEDSFP